MPGDASSERTYRKLKEVGVKPPSTPSICGSAYNGFSNARLPNYFPRSS
jgi:hypothetical protein